MTGAVSARTNLFGAWTGANLVWTMDLAGKKRLKELLTYQVSPFKAATRKQKSIEKSPGAIGKTHQIRAEAP